MATDDLPALLARFQRQADEGSAEHAAIAVFLFGAFPLFSGDFAKRFMALADDFEINWEQLLQQQWARHEKLLLRTAASLWRAESMLIAFGDAIATMTDKEWALWQAMISARRTSVIPDGFR